MKNRFLIIAISLFLVSETNGMFSRFSRFKTAFQNLKGKTYRFPRMRSQSIRIKKIISGIKIKSLSGIIFTTYALVNQKSRETLNSLLSDYFFPLPRGQQDNGISVVNYDPTIDPNSKIWMRGNFDQQDEFCKAIYLKGKLVGIVSYRRELYRRCNTCFHLASINVDPKFQGKGHGKTLIQYAIQDMISRGAESITLISTGNPVANKLYGKVGFKKDELDCEEYCTYTLRILKQ